MLGTNSFHAKTEWKFTAAASRCRRNFKYENFTLLLAHYVKTCTKERVARAAGLFLYYPTALHRAEIKPKTSTNITRYFYSKGPVRQVFSQRVSDKLDWSYEKKNCFSKRTSFLRFFLTEIFKWKTWIDVQFGRSKDDFSVVKNETNCASDGLVETTKTSLPCSPAVDQSVSPIFRANSVPLRILLSGIPHK